MAGGYLGNIYNSGAGEPDMHSYKMSFVNIETSKFNANTARFMVVIAVLTMFVFSVLSYVDNKIVHMICMVLFNLASLAAISGLVYLIAVHFNGDKQKSTTTQPNENFDSMDKTAGIIIGSTLGVFALIVIIGIISSTYMFRNVSGEDLVTIAAIDALAPRQNFMPRFTNGRRSPHHHRRSHRRSNYFM